MLEWKCLRLDDPCRIIFDSGFFLLTVGYYQDEKLSIDLGHDISSQRVIKLGGPLRSPTQLHSNFQFQQQSPFRYF